MESSHLCKSSLNVIFAHISNTHWPILMYCKKKFVSECRPNSFKISHFQVESKQQDNCVSI